jgi:hypothetical protein
MGVSGMKQGDKVIFTGCSPEQGRWGNYSGNFKGLIKGATYTVKAVRPHSWHTEVFLEGKEGSFNHVCFEPQIEERL